MKKIIAILGCVMLSVIAFAQSTVTLTFNGNTTRNNNRAYQVIIDGTTYNSTYATNDNDNNPNTITIPNLQMGQHSLQVYRLRNNNYGSYGTNNNSSTPQYSSTFNLRQGYDMDIAIRGNGQVQYTEKPSYNNRRRNRNYDRDRDRGYGQYNNRVAMSDNEFNQVLQNVRSKWFQSSKVTAERDAFNTTNYFSSYQITQLLQLITSEANRFELAKLSYRAVADPANFSQVINLFSNQAYRNDLEQYVRSNGGNYNNGNYNNGNYNNGYNNYRTPMSDAAYNKMLQKTKNHFFA